MFLDLTVEEAVVKFGFRYTVNEDWGRLRRLFRIGLLVRLGGGLAGGLALVILAPFSEALWGHDITVPLLIAALLPVVQAPEGIASAALFIGSRYDLRALYLALAMALRLVALAVGSHYGVAEAIAAVVMAQAFSTTAIVDPRPVGAAPVPVGARDDDRRRGCGAAPVHRPVQRRLGARLPARHVGTSCSASSALRPRSAIPQRARAAGGVRRAQRTGTDDPPLGADEGLRGGADATVSSKCSVTTSSERPG